MKILPLATVLMTLCAPAYAQNGSSPGSSLRTSSVDAQSQPENLTQEIRQQLESAGLKDVKVVPQTFLVEAKDQNNNTVHMAINGNSIMAVTDLSPSTTGSGSLMGRNSNSNSNDNSNSNGNSMTRNPTADQQNLSADQQ
jgi:hypothetical protein